MYICKINKVTEMKSSLKTTKITLVLIDVLILIVSIFLPIILFARFNNFPKWNDINGVLYWVIFIVCSINNVSYLFTLFGYKNIISKRIYFIQYMFSLFILVIPTINYLFLTYLNAVGFYLSLIVDFLFIIPYIIFSFYCSSLRKKDNE